eukprot:1621702-Pyramimonas_sp.AAC.1
MPVAGPGEMSALASSAASLATAGIAGGSAPRELGAAEFEAGHGREVRGQSRLERPVPHSLRRGAG